LTSTGSRSSGVSAALLSTAFAAITLACCGSTGSPHASASPRASTFSSDAAARLSSTIPIDASVRVAQATYRRETRGRKLFAQLARIAGDRRLLRALARDDFAAAQAEADAQLRSPANHVDHVTRISVMRGSRAVVNATLNPDGVFVVAPATRPLMARGRALGTLLVSLQDVTGFVKLVHRLTGAEVVARGTSGHVRTSLAAAAHAALPANGRVTIAGRSYVARSFHEIAWGGEQLTVWILA
jgi:hypothetical protein